MIEGIWVSAIGASLFDRAVQAAEREEASTVVLMCCASMEAFINEYMEVGVGLMNMFQELVEKEKKKNIGWIKQGSSTIITPLMPKERDLVNELVKLDSEWASVFQKMNAIKIHCSGNKWNKGDCLVQDFNTLIEIRNAVVHPRSKGVIYGDNHMPVFLSNFIQQKNINYFNEISHKKSWLEAIDTKAFANWCLSAFQEMMKAILDVMINWKIPTIKDAPSATQVIASNYFGYYKFLDLK